MLHLDFETYCDINVRDVGAQVYARHRSCAVLMMSWAFDDEPVELWVPDGPWDYGSMPQRVVQYLGSTGPVCAHNVEFEWNILWHVLDIKLELPRLRDTAALALRFGYPMSLDGSSKAVGLDVNKDKAGQLLIRKFCAPRKPSKNNPATRWYPYMAAEQWEEFKGYCIQDTVVERELWRRLAG